MELTPREKDKLLIFTAALLADRRMAREAKLEKAVAHLSAAILEGPRDGLWKPAYAKPAMVLKGGRIAAGVMGDPNASLPGDGAVLR